MQLRYHQKKYTLRNLYGYGEIHLTGQSAAQFTSYDRLIREILEAATKGVSKKAIVENFSLSKPQLRRLTAELISKDLLRYHRGLLVTSARGNTFLRKTADKTSISLVKAKGIAREIIMLDSNKTLLDARNSMLRYNISRVVISLNGKAAGIVTEKDIARFLYVTPPTRRINEIALKEIINKRLVTVRESASLENCAKLMVNHKISSVIVIDDNGKDKGIITKTDMIELYAYHLPKSVLVNEFMTQKVQSVAPDETIHMIAMLMATYKISRVVVKKNSKPVGIVTTRDFLPISQFYDIDSRGRDLTMRRETILAKRYKKFLPSGFIGIVLAEEIMNSPLITIHMNTTISEAAKIMIRNNISGLPVINQKEDLVGIITKTDILKTNHGK